MKRIFPFLFLFPFCGLTQLYTPGAGVTDIDGNLYQTIIVNNQEWMAENLRTITYANGDPIPNVTDDMQWQNLTTGAWAHYNNDSQYENPYGKLYNWYSVSDPRNVCPTGWHVPSDAEWTVLTDYLGGENVAGGKMKSTGTQYWLIPNQDATNESGFSGLPGGRRYASGHFESVGEYGMWWTSTEHSVSNAFILFLGFAGAEAYVGGSFYNKEEGKSVRCLNNNTSSINELMPNIKVPIKIVDVLGNETSIETNKLLFFLYNDGSVEKKIIIEQ